MLIPYIYLTQTLQYPLEQNSGTRKVVVATFSETTGKKLYSGMVLQPKEHDCENIGVET
jgi:hypothetical protein